MKWYQKATVQGAIATGVFAIIAALITVFGERVGSRDNSDNIKTESFATDDNYSKEESIRTSSQSSGTEVSETESNSNEKKTQTEPKDSIDSWQKAIQLENKLKILADDMVNGGDELAFAQLKDEVENAYQDSTLSIDKRVMAVVAMIKIPNKVWPSEVSEDKLLSEDLKIDSVELNLIVERVEKLVDRPLHLEALSKIITVQHLINWARLKEQ